MLLQASWPVLTRPSQRLAPCKAAVRPIEAVGRRPSVAELLAERGVETAVLQSAINRCPELLSSTCSDRVGPMIDLLRSEGFSKPGQMEQLLLKCPQVPTYCRSKAEDSLRFLSDHLGLNQQQRFEAVRRFPQVLGYGVKSWLVPQLAFLGSLGVQQEDLPALVMARPQVLGSNILLVTRWLTRYVKVPRNKVGAVLHLYPYDYSPAFDEGLRRYVAAQIRSGQQSEVEGTQSEAEGAQPQGGGDEGGTSGPEGIEGGFGEDGHPTEE